MTRSWHHLPRVLPYLRPYWKLALASVLLMLGGVAVSVAEPWPMAFMVNVVLGQNRSNSWMTSTFGSDPIHLLVVGSISVLVLALITNGVTVATEYVNTKLDHSMRLDFRADLFENAQQLSLTFHDQNRAGMFAQNINTHTAALGRIVVAIPALVQSILTLVVMFYISLRIDWQVALLALAVVPFIYYSTVYYGAQIEPRLMKTRNMEGQSLSIIHEAMQMLRVIIAFRRERYEYDKFVGQARDAVGERISITMRQTMFAFAVNVITAAGTAAVLGLGAYHVLEKQLTVGGLLVLMGYIASVYAPLQTISSTMAAWQEQLVDMHLALELLDERPEVVEREHPITLDEVRGEVVYDHVSFSYEKREGTLRDLSFSVPAGSAVAIVGPTGAGKTTLLNLLNRFYDVEEGRVLVDGVDVRDLTLDCLRNAISLVLQEPLLFQGSIRQNIEYGRLGATDEEIVAAAKAANAHDFIMKLPDQYETRLGERGSMLSGGERQRICVARAFLKDAPILVLDEPTSSIDSRTEGVILDALDRLMEGRTTFIVAHRLSTIRRADQVLVLQDGELVQHGPHAELVAQDGLYRDLWRAQVGDIAAIPEVAVTGPEGTAATPGPAPVPAAPAPAPAPAPVAPAGRPKAVVLGMMTKMPVAGVIWQTAHYLVGLERLGYEAYYVEAHGRTPSMLMQRPDDDGTALAAGFIDSVMRRFGLGDRWALHALHDRGQRVGPCAEQLDALYRDAAIVLNLHGGTEPLAEHAASGRLVYLETDPVQLQVELHEEQQRTIAFLEPHVAFFTFGEHYGAEDCGLPVSDRFRFVPTRQPVVLDFWRGHGVPLGDTFTTIGNWRQDWRPVRLGDEVYHWSKDREWARVLDLPARTGARLELALASYTDEDRARLEAHGWSVREALEISRSVDPYRRYIAGSLGEVTVAKDQNVRLRSGWFSDRSATYLAAGRPVITQDTGFAAHLPTGAGLFPFSDLDEAVAAVEAVLADPVAQSRAAARVARECFAHDVVLPALLDELGLPVQRGHRAAPQPPAPWPADLVVEPESRRPLVLPAATVGAVLTRRVPPPLATSVSRGDPDVSVVVVTHDNLVCLRLCVESVLAEAGQARIEVVVVDNASSDGTHAYLHALAAAHPEVAVIEAAANEGFAAGVNRGLASARGDVLVVLNDDVVVTPGWLDGLVGHLADDGVGAVGPVTNRCGTEAEVDADYVTYGGLLETAATRAASQRGRTLDVPMLAMFCVALRRSTYEAVGPLDEGYGLGLFEDDDYACRLREQGLRLVVAEDVFVHHFGEASFGALVPTGEHAQLFAVNRARFEARWERRWTPHARRPGPEYAAQRDRIVTTLREVLPADAWALVVSRGDDALLALDGRRATHFPQAPDGRWAGHHPGDSATAIAHLDALVAAGADHLVVPAASQWWFDHYEDLTRHLAAGWTVVHRDDDCTVLARRDRRPRTVASPGTGDELLPVVSR